MKLPRTAATAIAMLLTANSALAGTAAQEGAYLCTATDGSVYVTNERTADPCEPLTAEASGGAQPSAEPVSAGGSQPGAPAASGNASRTSGTNQDGPSLETRLSNYRESMIQGALGGTDAPAAAANPAVNRRYLMINRSNYRATQP